MADIQSQQASLRLTQGPIKEKYKADPTSALVTLRSSGSLDASSVTCTLGSDNANAVREAHKRVGGLHPMAGGPDPGISGELCSGDMLLDALVACAGVTLKAVATALNIPIQSGNVKAEGDLDFKGTLGVDKTAPVGFTSIRLWFDLKMQEGESVSEETLGKLGKLTERYCVVLQTIANKPQLLVRLDGTSAPEQGIERTETWMHKIED